MTLSTTANTLFIGMDGHKESIAVAYIARDYGAEATFLGTIGTRQYGASSSPRATAG